MPVQYNNTRLIDFITENEYKLKDPIELQAIQTLSERDQCCSGRFKTPCSKVSPPSDLGQALADRIQNSCSIRRSSQLEKVEDQVYPVGKGNRHQMKLSFKVLINSYKLSFDLLKSE